MLCGEVCEGQLNKTEMCKNEQGGYVSNKKPSKRGRLRQSQTGEIIFEDDEVLYDSTVNF